MGELDWNCSDGLMENGDNDRPAWPFFWRPGRDGMETPSSIDSDGAGVIS